MRRLNGGVWLFAAAAAAAAGCWRSRRHCAYSVKMMLQLCLNCVLLLLPLPQRQSHPVPRIASLTSIDNASSFGLWAAGALSGFVAHETGHLLTNYLFDNKPALVGLKGFGFVPFFAISPELVCDHDGCRRPNQSRFQAGRRGMYLISTAGFTVQHLTSEMALSKDPWLMYHNAPFEKGLLTFNLLLSVGYALSTLVGIEDAHGDAAGAAAVAHMPRALFATLLVLPVAADTVRFLRPCTRWAVGVSRASKAAMVGVAYTF